MAYYSQRPSGGYVNGIWNPSYREDPVKVAREAAEKKRQTLVREAQYAADAKRRHEQDARDRTYRNLMRSFQSAQTQARTANVERYQQGLSGYDEILEMLKGQGTAERTDIMQRSKQAVGRAEQDLVSRGLTGSTVLPGVRSTYASALNTDLQRLNESIARLKASIMGNRIGFIERRTDSYPDMNQFLNLAQGYGGVQA